MPAGWSRPEGVEDGANRKRRPGTAYHSTRLTVELEQKLDRWWYGAGTELTAPIVDGDQLEEAIIAAGLDDDKGAAQARLVRAICAGGNRVVSIVGPAGGGKTTMMRGVVEAAKVRHVPIAVGDPKQLGAINNAGWWAHVVTATEGTAADNGRPVADYSLHHLEEEYRFKAPWEGLGLITGEVVRYGPIFGYVWPLRISCR